VNTPKCNLVCSPQPDSNNFLAISYLEGKSIFWKNILKERAKNVQEIIYYSIQMDHKL
jgi:hypothetical protein